MAQRLLDFSQPFDVGLLDATVQAVYRPGFSQEGSEAEKVLRALQEHPDTWMQVVNILSNSKSIDAKYFALQVLESVVKYRWNALPVDQRDGIKNYISDLIIRLSTNEATFRSERVYLNKLNIVLVQVLKHDWPHRWPTFLGDLVGAAKTSETVCENCMVILKLLSEEIFDFSRGEMTQSKIKELKSSLNKEFQLINELCQYVLACSNRPPLIRATLATLHAFLSWIPLAYIFESPLIEVLLKLFPTPHYRNLSVQCLTEIASLTIEGPYDAPYMNMLAVFLTSLQTLIPVNSNMASAYDQGSDDDQAFIQNVGLFLTSFLKNHLPLLENNPPNHPYLLMALSFLIQISYVSDIEVFKSCLDYWHHLVSYLFQKECSMENSAQSSPSGLQVGIVGMGQTMSDGIGQISPRKLLYQGHLSQIRTLMITRMAKPEEVIVVEDENGNVVRETLKDNDVLAQYKIMRETLIYLSHLDYDDTERQMTTRLENQSNNHEFIWNDLNTLCWAIGSISGSMIEEQENRFLVTVIRELLNLCEITRGKNNKAIIASNIMYVVGQYPRFLKAHWKFLKTVVNKLFEFMHESHPGVQDMACDTFLKIVQKTRRKFVIHQLGEVEPFICELLRGLSSTILDLQPSQIHTFYEAVGYMISAEIEASRRDEYLHKLMQLPNDRWSEIIKQAHVNSDSLKDREVIRNVLNILQTNTSVASSLGHPFLSQLSAIFLDMLNVYKMYSEIISKLISEGGPYAARSTDVKLLRSVKREVLKLIETFMEKSDDNELIANQFVPAMTDPILGDYARNVPDARESEVLSLFAAIIDKLKGLMLDKVPSIFEAVFECTLQMITKNMEDYPDHRLKFFSLLRAIAAHCFSALFALNSAHLKVMMDSVFWAIRHTERNIAEIGLNLLLEMLNNFQNSPFCNQFHRAYFMNIEREIFIVMTDTFHKPGFKLHALILHHLFCLLNSGSLTEPLWDASALGLSAYPSNEDFVGTETVNLLASSFPNISGVEVNAFVKGLFSSRDDIQVFKNHLRDFLVQTKEFSDKDNKELYADENAAQQEMQRQQMMQVPGLIPPSSLPYDNRMEG